MSFSMPLLQHSSIPILNNFFPSIDIIFSNSIRIVKIPAKFLRYVNKMKQESMMCSSLALSLAHFMWSLIALA